ncbi:HDOD domain-containing protein [Agaribacterium haliotis]|uniref:HDOD domain-containing protein n=1 Tax=Agaribacterium haliotis TaxID=2013869 RepID=UPI001EFC4B73|nr:HDOD domain-containing protein [Agaribacterium haliotis]
MAASTDSSVVINDILERIKKGNVEVPMLPEVAGKVVRLTQDPNSDAAELARLIQSDQSLAAHVMRVANSAAYSPNASMVSLQQAITRLGMRVIAEIALAASINSTLFNTPGYEHYIQHIFTTSLAAGLWAKETARACRKNVEAAFLAGLLTDIGRPLAVQLSLELGEKHRINISRSDLADVESACARAIALMLLDAWGMPETVKNVVAYFDKYKQEHNGKIQTSIVVAGSAIANHFFGDKEKEDVLNLEQLKTHPAFAEINLYQDEVEQLLEREELVKTAMEAMQQ